jgi:hypothetical protein
MATTSKTAAMERGSPSSSATILNASFSALSPARCGAVFFFFTP